MQWKGNIGTIATVLSLIAAMVYGPPAWKLAQAQLTLAIQGMRLSQWATCADHDVSVLIFRVSMGRSDESWLI